MAELSTAQKLDVIRSIEGQKIQKEQFEWRANAIPATSIKPTPIRWIWPGWLAAGKLIILAGAGGAGKTTLALGLISTMSCAGRWPDGGRCSEPRSAIIWSSEDDPADTIIPRLMASGANLAKVYILQGRVNGLGQVEPFDPAKDTGLLAAEMERIGDVGLIMIDPIVSAVAGDMHRANDVRRALQGLVDLAERYECAVLGITHFSKGSAGSNPAERVLGSQAFGALARTVLVAAKQEDSSLRVLARAKSNISDDSGGCSYSIEERTVGDGLITTCVLWGETIEGTAREILADVEGEDSEEKRSAFDEACDFLKSALADGPIPVKQLKSDADGNGLTWATVRRAQKALGVRARKAGMESGWSWELPQGAHRYAEGAQDSSKALRENSEHLREEMSTFGGSAFDDADAEDF